MARHFCFDVSINVFVVLLWKFDLFGKSGSVFHNIYLEQTACMRVENKLKLEWGVRQECVFHYRFIRDLQRRHIKITGNRTDKIRYSDDSVLIADPERELKELLDRLEEESVKKVLISKKEIMVVSNRKSSRCELQA